MYASLHTVGAIHNILVGKMNGNDSVVQTTIMSIKIFNNSSYKHRKKKGKWEKKSSTQRLAKNTTSYRACTFEMSGIEPLGFKGR